jgi:hypothetical protein
MFFSPEGTWTQGCLEGTWCPYHHDRYPHRPPVVHLRRCQGRAQPPPTSTTNHARIAQEEARCRVNSKIYLFPVNTCYLFNSITSFRSLYSSIKPLLTYCAFELKTRASAQFQALSVNFELFKVCIKKNKKISQRNFID